MTTELEQVLLARQKLALLKKQQEIRSQFGIVAYRPYDKQALFHSLAGSKYRFFQAGNRSGKSTCGVAEDLAFALGERPWLDPKDPARFVGIPKTKTNGLIIASSWGKVEEVFSGDGSKGKTGKIWSMLPKGHIVKTSKNSEGVIDNFVIKGLYGNSTITLMSGRSFDSDPKSFESSDYDWVHFDEPCKEALFTAVNRGLVDRNGRAWFTGTLLEEPWIMDFFDGTTVELGEESSSNRVTVTASMLDNPYISEEGRREFIETLTPEERECRIYGKPLILSGLVYKEFDQTKHVLLKVPKGWKDFKTPPSNYTIYVRIDPHPRTPHAVLFAAVAPTGEIFIYDEIFQATTIHNLSAMILEKTKGKFLFSVKVDPIAWNPNPIDGTTIADVFRECGLHGIVKASKDLSTGILKTKEYLRGEKDPIYFSPELKTTIWEIKRYPWANKHGVPTNKPVDKDDHMMENLRRLLIDKPYWVDQSTASPVDDVTFTNFKTLLTNDIA